MQEQIDRSIQRISELQYSIAKKLYELFVVNDKFVALQMPDGKYIPKRINCTVEFINAALNSKASFGVYQQQYCRDTIKWICMDFDMKDGGDLEELVKLYVLPAIENLEKNGVHFLVEFSGRRGIHIWISIKGTMSKTQGYQLVKHLVKKVQDEMELNENYGLDIFPASAHSGNKYGKHVKLPLSVHKKGKRSFFISHTSVNRIDEWLYQVEDEIFWKQQFQILKDYEPNDLEELCSKVQLPLIANGAEKFIFYKKQYIIGNINLSLQKLQEISGESAVLTGILKRAEEGQLRYLDRLVLVGALQKVNGGDLLRDILRVQNNYKEEMTNKYLSQLSERYYPVTINYLYDIYNASLENGIRGELTVLEYWTDKLGVVINEIEEVEECKEKDVLAYWRMLQQKELKYMQYDDEVLSVSQYLNLREMKFYDYMRLEKRLNSILTGRMNVGEEISYLKYERWEKNKEEPRILLTLDAEERLLTTALIFELAKRAQWTFNSYSYNLNFWPDGTIFFPWFDSWKRFRNEVELYLQMEAFEDYGLVKLDLSRYYDSIYFHSFYSQLEKKVSQRTKDRETIENILFYLGNYTEKLMKMVKGNICGVPQGPAYARVIAEVFLASLLNEFEVCYGYGGKQYHLFRYVDDIFIVYHNIDGNKIFENLEKFLGMHGLKVNHSKCRKFTRIGDMKEWQKRELFEDGEWNYTIKNIQGLRLEEEEDKEEKLMQLEQYLVRKGEWDIKDANFILNGYIDDVYVERYLQKYTLQLMRQSEGRGSIYQRLYREIFKRPTEVKRVFKAQWYKEIPLSTVNFSNFISVCYFCKAEVEMLEKETKIQFIRWLEEIDGCSDEELATIGVIITIIGKEENGY